MYVRPQGKCANDYGDDGNNNAKICPNSISQNFEHNGGEQAAWDSGLVGGRQ